MRHSSILNSVGRRARAVLVLVAFTLPAVACAAGGGGPAANAGPAPMATESEWHALATERPTPMASAVRISVGEVDAVDDDAFDMGALGTDLGLSELIVAGLLRRPDVHFVERRRFAAAVEASRRGTLSPDAPPLGVSEGPELILSVEWATYGASDGTLEMRLTDAETGAVRHAWRQAAPADAGPVGVARTVVGSLVATLSGMGRAPAWSDPIATAAPSDFMRAAIGAEALSAYARGLAAEEEWQWEAARRGYQSALAAEPTFFEAEVALARTARLRMGGTLGAS